MNFNFGKEKPLSTKAIQNARLKALNAADEMHVAFENLSDSYKQLDEVCAVVENLDQAINMIRTFGLTDQTKTVLNFDGGLESLFGSIEKLDAKIALEEMNEQKSHAWETFKEGCAKVIEYIKNFFKMIGEKFMELFRKLHFYKKAYEEGEKEGNAEYNNTFIKTVIPEGKLIILPGVINDKSSEIRSLIADFSKYAEYMFNKNYTDEMFNISDKLNSSKVFDDLENDKFFFRSHGESIDTWEHIGYTNPNAIFAEIDKLHDLVQEIDSINKVVGKLERVIADAKALADAKAVDADLLIQHVSNILRLARRVTTFMLTLFRVEKSMVNAVGYTINAVDKSFGINKDARPERDI